MKSWAIVCACIIATISTPVFAQNAKNPMLRFDVIEGTTQNQFVRDGNISAHIVLRSGAKLRALVAFPAGNSGVSIWFRPQEKGANWQITKSSNPIIQKDAKERNLYGVEFEAKINTNQLEIQNVLLGSIRTIRDYEYKNPIAPEIYTSPKIDKNTIIYARERLDGECSYFLSLEILNGQIIGDKIIAENGELKIKFRALSGEKPLTPLGGAELVKNGAKIDSQTLNTLNFLSYEDKFLAGSWRFNTYFGRDTLLSLKLMMPELTKNAVESGLQSVLARLGSTGEVAHEEAIGEFAIVENLKKSPKIDAAPFFDYSMIDGNYLLPIILRDYFLSSNSNKLRLKEFLAKTNESGQSNGASLVNNFGFIIATSQNFAQMPKYQNLIALKDGKKAGQWRDSDFGLGGGIYPYDVNAVFVPNALMAIDDLYKIGALSPYLDVPKQAQFKNAIKFANAWKTNAPRLFEVSIPAKSANQIANRYAKDLGIKPRQKFIENVNFHAISLDKNGAPIRVENSDEGFELLFANPDDKAIKMAIAPLLYQFPFGTMTDVGMVVANAVFTDKPTQEGFNKNQYHGAVIWSWQQTLMAQGIAKQLARKDIKKSTRQDLLKAQTALWRAIKNGQKLQNSELWTWEYQNGKFAIAHFGQNSGDVDETNAAQLWSSASLALKPPK